MFEDPQEKGRNLVQGSVYQPAPALTQNQPGRFFCTPEPKEFSFSTVSVHCVPASPLPFNLGEICLDSVCVSQDLSPT